MARISKDDKKDKPNFTIYDLLIATVKNNASDLHIKEGSPPTVRIECELIPIGEYDLTEEDCIKFVFEFLSKEQKELVLSGNEVDLAISIPEGRFRVNAFLQRNIPSAAYRKLFTDLPTFEDLNLPPVLKKLADFNNGLLLVTGPAGSGKSTTLASIINYINHHQKKHIITLEEPIEYIHTDKFSIITQREVGTDTSSFSNGLKMSLRQDPNVILVGEMRDPDTIMTAVTAAETGHFVLSTLHTPNSIQAIDSIIDVFSGEQQKQFRILLANTLKCVISQKLLVRRDNDKRIPAVEIMTSTSTIRSLILESKTHEIYQYIVQGKLEGMVTFTESLFQLYKKGLITYEDALYHAERPTELRLLMDGQSSVTETIIHDNLIDWL